MSSLTPPPRHNIIFTIPRTSSNLLTQILNLSAQPGIHRVPSDGYVFLPPLVHRFRNNLAGKNVNDWTHEERSGMTEAFQKAYNDLNKWTQEAEEEGKGMMIKEHINWLLSPVAETRFLFSSSPTLDTKFTIQPAQPIQNLQFESPSENNETCFPDSILSSLAPTILIRNPLLTLPSLLRTSIDIEGLETALATPIEQWEWETSYHWSRTLYAFYASLPFPLPSSVPEINYPIILDADDLPDQELMRRYASAVRLDPSLIRFSWPVAPKEEIEASGKNIARMKDTLLASSGIVKGKTSQGLTIEGEMKKWEKEFGNVLTGRLVELWEGAKEDYVWLFERRFR